MNKTNKQVKRIPVTDPWIVAIMEQGNLLDETLKVAGEVSERIQGASVNVGIAMWVRLRQHLVCVAKRRDQAFREIGIVRRAGVQIDPEQFDAVVASLHANATALYALGRYGGAVGVMVLFECCRLANPQPTQLLPLFVRTLTARHNMLAEELYERMWAEVERHQISNGRAYVRDGQVHFRPADKAGGTSFIVLESPQ